MGGIIDSEALLIVISGVIIFAAQNLISELWIKPLVTFRQIKAKIEVLILRYAYLTQVSLGVSDISDKEIYFFKDELRKSTGELIASFNNLPFLEKFWFKRFNQVDVIAAKGPLIGLSNIIATPSDAARPITLASEFVDEIRKHLNLIA